MIRQYAEVNFTFEGYHRWKNAPDRRDYLRNRHRHLFHVKVIVEVKHDAREIEYHDLLDFIKVKKPLELGNMSCEQVATQIAWALNKEYPKRNIEVRVMEDGENGAIITYTPEE